jgi:2-polyprenyl-6-hydroxyphenyl methylase/3-demethylubiquinone-9 3-methyltransferase
MHFDAQEVNKFNDLAHQWWNIDGEFKTLHHINPVRLKFVTDTINLNNKSVIDVGCGGGIFAESMASIGAHVSGIDLAPQSIETAKLHLYESNLKIDYECIDIETYAKSHHEQFDVVTCMEMLEHVPNPEIIIENCNHLLKPGGLAFFSTINRNPKSYALGVIAAEYIMNIIPRGTHEYKKFIKPSELSHLLSKHGFEIFVIKGMEYNPLTEVVKISNNVDINYMVACRKII